MPALLPEGSAEATRELSYGREKGDKPRSDLFPSFHGEAKASLSSVRQDGPSLTQGRQSLLWDQAV